MAAMDRVRRITGITVGYLRGWRGGLIVGVSVFAGLLIGLVAGSWGVGLAIGVVVASALGVVGLFLANLDHRLGTRPAPTTASPALVQAVETVAAPTARVGPPAVPTQDRAPLVGVVMTAWNEARFIEIAIESLKRQTLHDFECVIVNDASTDDTERVALDAIDGDRRFTLVRSETNVGPGRARNIGLDRITAPFVTFIDGDDFLFPESLAIRLHELSGSADVPWVAGTYCHWVNVPEAATIPIETPDIRQPRSPVTWLTSLTDAPFTVSAPLLRMDVVRAVGGFPDIPTAEDALFWNRVLREGYVFLPVQAVGVAYRMKASSLFRRTASDHARLVAAAYSENAVATDVLAPSAPYAFTDGAASYLWETTLVRRQLAALANAVEVDSPDVDGIVDAIGRAMRPYHLWELPLDSVVMQQATRACRYLDDGEFVPERDRVVTVMETLLRPIVDGLIQSVDERQREMEPTALTSAEESRTLTRPTRRSVSISALDSPSSPVAGRVILMPSATYHVDETGPIGDALERRGIESVVMVSERRWPLIEHAQAAYRQPVIASVETGPWIGRAAAVLVMNDWGEEYREYVEMANELGVPSFAKVEGVQDFQDDDVHWDRRAYQRAGTILAQGDNDVAALPGRQTVKVSSNRLERIWTMAPQPVDTPLVVVNLNFTYGVLEDARDMWMSSVADACAMADVPFVVSLHPAERDRFDGRYPIANAPMRHLLTRASALVSRFSTVPFEAMARGVPFVYHNPHGERVPTFLDPRGAYDVTDSVEGLADSLRRSFDEQTGARDRAAAFFLAQVDVRPDEPAPDRAANVIAEAVRS